MQQFKFSTEGEQELVLLMLFHTEQQEVFLLIDNTATCLELSWQGLNICYVCQLLGITALQDCFSCLKWFIMGVLKDHVKGDKLGEL